MTTMVQKKKETASVVSQTQIADRIYDMWLRTDMALTAGAGQFIGIYPKDRSALLPRPISICETDKGKGLLRVVYRAAGKGTGEFAGYRVGGKVDVLGVLGNGFPAQLSVGKKVFLIGGGIGIPPLLELARVIHGEPYRSADIQIIAGYRDHQLFLKEDLEKYGKVYAATEDGSAGIRGNVMDAIDVHGLEAELIYACGPLPMLRAVKQYAGERGIEAYLSLEERMACGVGACLGCVCRTVDKDAHSQVHNARICTDGPVFRASEVDI